MKSFADTGLFFALMNPREPYHTRAARFQVL